VQGLNKADLDRWSVRLADAMTQDREHFTGVASDLQNTALQASVNIDRDKARALGINADQLRSTLTALEGTLKAAQRTMQIYANPDQGPTAEITKTMTAFRQLSGRLDSTLASPAFSRRTDSITANLAAMTSQFAATGERLDTLLAGMNRGQGTLGKFVTDSGLYYDIRELTQGMKKLLEELSKHPGKIPVTVKLF